MAHDKYSTWNRQIWHPQNMVPYKNGTTCKKKKKKCLNLIFAKDWAEWFLKGNS